MPSERVRRRSRGAGAFGRARRRTPARALAIALAATAPLALWGPSCVLRGFEKVDATETPPDAGPDTAMPNDAGDGSTSCTPVTYPALIEGTDTAVNEEFVVAINSLNLGETQKPEEWRSGLDFDRLCTCPDETLSCKPRGDGKLHCDGPDGRDVGSVALFSGLKGSLALAGFSSSAYSMQIEQGDWTLLLRVRKYNGAENDSNVELDWYLGTDFGASPSWDGNDAWPIDPGSLIPSSDLPSGSDPRDFPKYRTRNAYVTAWRLVASFPDELKLGLGGGESKTEITLSDATLLATIETVPGLPGRLVLKDGTIAGLWSEREIFTTLGNSPLLCGNAIFYDIAKNAFCEALDITLKNSPPSTPCNALSLGLGFDTHPVQLGMAAADPGGSSDMPPTCATGIDPANDACPE